MRKIRIIKADSMEILTSNGRIAEHFITRAIGLMGRKVIADDYCLVIDPCQQIHMMNMRFSIEVIYLDNDNKVIAIDEKLKPWTIGRRQAYAESVIECNVGYLSQFISIDDILVFEQVD